MCAATDEHDALDLVRRYAGIGQLLIDVGNDFSRAGTDIVGSLGGIETLDDNIAHVVGVQGVVDILLDVLGGLFKHIQSRHDVTRQVASTQWQGVQVDQGLVAIDGHCGGFGTHIHEHAAQFAVALAQDLLSHSQRGNDIVLDGDAKGHQSVEVEFERRFSDDEVNPDLDRGAELSHGIDGLNLVDIERPGDDIDSVVVADGSARCLMYDAVDEFLGDGFGRSHTAIDLTDDAVQRTTAHAHIHLGDAAIHHTLKILEDAVDAALDILDILHDAIPHAVEVALLLQMLYTQVSCRRFLGNGSNDFGTSDFKCYNVLVLFHKSD